MDIVTYALAKNFALKVAAGFSSVRVDEPNCAIIFTLNDQKKVTLHIPKPKDGVSVEDIEIVEGLDKKKYIMFTMSDGTIINGGEFPDVDIALKQDLVATQAIGSVVTGKKYLAGTEIEQIIRDMLIKVENPTVTLSLTPNKTLYDIVDESITSITLTAKVTKKTYDVANVKFYVGDTLIETKNTDVAAGGTFNYVYTPATPIKANTTFKVIVTDVKNGSGQSTSSVSFVGKSYYGIVSKDMGDPTEAEIKTLNKILKASKGYVYNNIVCDFNKIIYAYPQSMGALTSIKDVINNFNYTNSFTRTSVKIDNIDYYCYTLTEPTGADGVQLTFA